jgi:hypothetical protein
MTMQIAAPINKAVHAHNGRGTCQGAASIGVIVDGCAF